MDHGGGRLGIIHNNITILVIKEWFKWEHMDHGWLGIIHNYITSLVIEELKKLGQFWIDYMYVFTSHE